MVDCKRGRKLRGTEPTNQKWTGQQAGQVGMSGVAAPAHLNKHKLTNRRRMALRVEARRPVAVTAEKGKWEGWCD